VRLERITLRPATPVSSVSLPPRAKPYRVVSLAFRYTVVAVNLHSALWQLSDSTGSIISAGYSGTMSPNEDNLVSFLVNAPVTVPATLAAPPFLHLAYLPPDLWVMSGEVFSARVEEATAADFWPLLMATIAAVE